MGKWINLKTELPGPKSLSWGERKEKAVCRAYSLNVPIMIDKAKGAVLTDIDGNQFIDLTGGIGCLNVGHCHPEVVEAVKEQAERFFHTDFTVVPYTSFVELAERLSELLPGNYPKKATFFNSGAEAVENACKIAKYYTNRRAFIAFEGAFHGRTLMAMSLTSKIMPYKHNMGPFAPEVYRIPFAYCYRCPVNLEYPSCDIACAKQLERAFLMYVEPTNTAAVVGEPVLGEGGFVVPPKEFYQRIREICDKNGVLLILDEVQSGIGRTGKFFAHEHFGITADLVTVAKSVAGGIPISGVVGRAEVMDAPHDSAIGGTYVGNPIGCVAALKVIEVIKKHNLLEKGMKQGKTILDRFNQWKKDFKIVGDVRGLGAMCGIEFVRDRKTKEPAPKETARIKDMAFKNGVLVLKAGIYGNVIRMLAPLVTEEDQLNEALDVMEKAVAEVNASL
ncbi:MAG: 4-aminobutyrate--2-oxoglutarate transaminase [Firmicutes bacterium]|nr:4-aminobutyrate--2-oxoglutarate transaminase [Bacillota bacterium]